MSKKSTKFAKLERKMVYSKAYQDLNAPTLKILSYALLQLKWVNVSRQKEKPKFIVENKDKIELLYTTFTKPPFCMCRQTITRAIDSLLAHGFVKVVEQGGMCKGHKTIFGYADEWVEWKAGEVLFIRMPFFARGFANKGMV